MGLEILGFTVITVVGMALALLVKYFAADPAFVQLLATVHPSLSAHATGIGWTALGVVCIITMLLPPLLMFKTDGSGKSLMDSFGRGASIAIQAIAAGLWLPSFAYLLGLGWFAAKQVIGQ